MAMVLPRLHAHPPPASYLVEQSKCTAWSYNKEAGVGGVNAFRTNKDGSGSVFCDELGSPHAPQQCSFRAQRPAAPTSPHLSTH